MGSVEERQLCRAVESYTAVWGNLGLKDALAERSQATSVLDEVQPQPQE